VTRYRLAALAECGLDPEKLARLTDRQVELLYAHPREKTGELRKPLPEVVQARKPLTLAQKKAALKQAAREVGMRPEDLAQALAELEAKRGPGDTP
jgi:hypothetical protein